MPEKPEDYSNETLCEFIIEELSNKPTDRATLLKIYYLLRGLED